MLPDLDTKLKDQNEKAVPQNFYLQNVHPWLAMYKHDFVTTHMSYDKFCTLVSDDNEHNLFQLLTDLRLLNTCQQCKNCGGSMRNLNKAMFGTGYVQEELTVSNATTISSLSEKEHSLISRSYLFNCN